MNILVSAIATLLAFTSATKPAKSEAPPAALEQNAPAGVKLELAPQKQLCLPADAR